MCVLPFEDLVCSSVPPFSGCRAFFCPLPLIRIWCVCLCMCSSVLHLSGFDEIMRVKLTISQSSAGAKGPEILIMSCSYSNVKCHTKVFFFSQRTTPLVCGGSGSSILIWRNILKHFKTFFMVPSPLPIMEDTF